MTIRLTRDADADIADILRYTRDEFGLPQTARYRDFIRRAFGMIDDDPMRPGSRVLEQFGPHVRMFHLGSAAGRRSGAAHIVVYHIGEQSGQGWRITVLRILHERMEPDRHLSDLP
ncbi:type II toxin-antitoxin system RelE/ParE family toxin [Rhizobium sp. C4]|uniref:type II toxin-antitoxin system RelE/ParE family toxin n=1 Tax=Rhizobium sp. C4 TaxID=1349800 RepID=UPI001E425859|nr:type II toxin-antitoxin system RelE/ParE family toxin [Rhizobium sp. C4]MCD2171933.1 type II toxin-antitoxin system RelE/ParE family toxin [Rhizobium sp. C4]